MLADNERRINSIDEAITVDAPKHPALTFYSKDDALTSATAAVTYCMDATQTYPKDRGGGRQEVQVVRRTTVLHVVTASALALAALASVPGTAMAGGGRGGGEKGG
ncbi:hypothetical protein AB0K80_04330 [Streptomyces sp. NPDC052682]|uniref:hypothetical protein n=1 Tax=Streptomyces sp. NPDC052682 TaxID=3154954 RepID=UPI0034488952